MRCGGWRSSHQKATDDKAEMMQFRSPRPIGGIPGGNGMPGGGMGNPGGGPMGPPTSITSVISVQ